MTRTIYALLVGIDAYPAPVRPLNGCVNDIQRVQALLADRMDDDSVFKPLVLTDAQATRTGIIEAFRSHLGQAQPGDVALFYYSGHGSQAPSPPEFWHLEPDRLDETLVCYDSRGDNGWDLADKELAQLIAEVAASEAHVLVILDCCHSGSGTRAADTEDAELGVAVRRVPTDDRLRPLETFIVSTDMATALAGAGTRSAGSGWAILPYGRHVVFSACRSDEKAKELSMDGEIRGVFSYYLLQTLQQSSAGLTYRDLYKRIDAQVRGKVSLQTPLLEATETGDLDQPFLGGAVRPRPAYFTARYDDDLGWNIDGGAIHGVPAPRGGETTHLALFPIDIDLDALESLQNAVGDARVTSVLAHASQVEITLADGALDQGHSYRAVITALPLPPLRIRIEGNGEGVERLRNALAGKGSNPQASLLVAEAQQPEEAEIRVLVHPEGYQILRVGDVYPLAVDVRGNDDPAAELAVGRLDHIARWLRLYTLENPASRIAADEVRLTLYRVLPDNSEVELAPDLGDLRIEYEYRDGKWHQPRFKIKLTNTGSRRLYCALLDLSAKYAIYSALLPGSGEWLEPGQELWAARGKAVYGAVDKDLWEAGVISTHDLLKVIVSTNEFDATLMDQDELPITVAQIRSAGVSKSAAQMNTLNRLLNRVTTRSLRIRPEEEEDYVDWTTHSIGLTMVRPQNAVDVAGEGRDVPLGHGVTVQGHPTLKAKARLTTTGESGRSLGNLLLPPVLRTDDAHSQPFEFSSSRNGEPGLSVLELFDVENYEAVTPEQPLLMQAGMPLAEDEHVLPIAYDGEFFLPLGVVQRGEAGVFIRLDRLPAPTVAGGMRDLKGSIHILFQKIVGERFGADYVYPVLAAASLGEDCSLVIETDLDAVRERVNGADRILLVTHGIIGDTRGMATTALRHLAPEGTLVLSFDYENINTTIEETARTLKERLAEVGLAANHGKQVTILAHSMGGLVSRWFIEHEGGNEIVDHLVMCGTPNAGSPWPTVQAWATTAIGVGLNSLSTVAWPVKVLGGLLSAVEAVDVTLDQMQANSEILKTLAKSQDPGVRYTILAGNTSLVAAALQPPASGGQSAFARLLARLSSQNFLHSTTALAFFGEPNDIAVSVKSIRKVSTKRSPRPKVKQVACDHLTYFSAEAGVSALIANV